jgi:hypothetical protein
LRPARRDRRAMPHSGTRSRLNGSRSRTDRPGERAGGPRERRPVARAGHLHSSAERIVLRTRSSRSTTCSTDSPGSWKASSSGPSGCSPTSKAGHGTLFFSQRLLCPGRERDVEGRRTAASSVTRCAPGTRVSTSASWSVRTRTLRDASRSTWCSRSMPTSRTSTPCSSDSRRSSLRRETVHA